MPMTVERDIERVHGGGLVTAASMECDRNRTLIVDDEAVIVRIMKMILAYAFPNLQVDAASNGAEAVHLFSQAHYALLLMDLAMPIMDGRTAFREIGKLCEARCWVMPSVVFCTAYAPHDFLDRLPDDHGRHGLIQKPFGMDLFVDMVRDRLRG